MRLRGKLLTIVLFVALVPLAMAALSTLHLHQAALEEQVVALQEHAAASGAARARGHFERLGRAVSSYATERVRWSDLGPAERRGALWLMLKELDGGLAVGVARRGEERAWARVQLEGTRVDPADERHHRPADVAANGVSWGVPFAAAQGGDPRVVLVANVFEDGEAGPWEIRATVSLEALCRTLAEQPTAHLTRQLVDPRGRPICGSVEAEGVALVGAVELDGETQFSSAAPAGLGFSVLAAQPAGIALAPSRRLELMALLWIALAVAVALVAGRHLAGDITGPVGELLAGAERLAAGDFSHRIGPRGNDELAELGRAFDAMSDQIRERDEEIRSWNDELRHRVEARTRELEGAYEQLQRSHNIAAMSRLGAGLAHEINSPLTSVLGIVQLLQERARSRAHARDAELLDRAGDEAQRIRTIMKRLLALSRKLRADEIAHVEMDGLLQATLRMSERSLVEHGVSVECDLGAPGVAVRGDFSALQQALLQLVDNARVNSPAGARIRVRTRLVGDDVEVCVRDEGKLGEEGAVEAFEPFAIVDPETESDGLSLAIAYRIADEHGGRLEMEADEPGGTTIRLLLPCDGPGDAAAPSPTHDQEAPWAAE